MQLFVSSKRLPRHWAGDGFTLKKTLRIMKIAAFLLTVFSIQVSAEGNAQNISLSLRNEPIQRAFTLIEKQAGYTFIYTKSSIVNANPVTLQVNNEKLEKVLILCFDDQPFTYTIVDKYIVVKQKEISVPKGDITQNIEEKLLELHGQVSDEKGKPVIRATVIEKGTANTTITNDNGEFVLPGVRENGVIVISSVGYMTQEIKLNGKNNLLIQLKISVSEIEGVAVSDGYQNIPKERATGSFEKVDNKLFNRSVSTNILAKLEGIIPGLVFNRRIGVNNPNDFSIRGISTLQSDQKPLIVVDNFPYEGNIDNINPNDVESITILKDAAAASIWGAKAGNGVVVITTKKGKYSQKTSVSFNSNITVSGKPDLFYISQFPSSDFIDVEAYLFEKGFFTSQLTNASDRPILTPVVEILAKRKVGLITPADSASRIDLLRNIDVRNDYLKYLYRKTINQQYNLSFSGGKEDVNYLFSVGYDKNLNDLVGNEQDRITIRLQNNIRPVKNLELQIGGLYTQNNSQNNSPGVPLNNGKASLYPYAKLVDNDGKPLAIEMNYRGSFTDTVGNGNLLDWKYRPLQEIDLADNTSKTQDILLNLGATYHFTPALSGEVKYQYEKQTGIIRNYYSPLTYYSRNLINLFTPTGGIASVNSAIPYGGILDITSVNLLSHSVRGQLNFNRVISSQHDINVIAGTELRQVQSNGFRNRTYGYDDEVISYRDVDYLTFFPTYENLMYSQKIPSNIYFSDRTNRFVSLYTNASYTYNKRYTFSVSGRRDASNLFGVATNNKWKPLWSVGGSWNVSNEKFYKFSSLPQLKLKATHGYSGNVNNSIAAVLTLAAYGPNLVNLPMNLVNNPPNPSLRWENVNMTNLAVEFATKNNRLSGAVEYYIKKSTDLISRIPADLTSGFSSLTVNSAILTGKGWDIAVNSKNILNKTFQWETDIIFSYNTNKLKKYLAQETSNFGALINDGSQITQLEGQPANSIVSYKWGGLDASGNPQGYIGKQLSTDYNSFYSNATLDDLVFHGSARPTYFGAIRNSFNWKGISLSVNIIYRLGYYFKNLYSINYTTLFGGHRMGYADYSNRWQKPGDEISTNVPSMIYPSNSYRDNFYGSSEINIAKAGNIRLQDINLSYQLDRISYKKLPVKQVRIYVYANNLGIIWKANKWGVDPDYGTPPSKSISIGLKADF